MPLTKTSTETEQPIERITLRSIFRYLIDAFDIRKGHIYTFKELLIRPGTAIKTYLQEDRSKLSLPFRFLILSTVVSTYLVLKTDIYRNMVVTGGTLTRYTEEERVFFEYLFTKIMESYTLSFYLMIPFSCLFFKLFLRKSTLYFGERFY